MQVDKAGWTPPWSPVPDTPRRRPSGAPLLWRGFTVWVTQIECSKFPFCVILVMDRAPILERLDEAERLVADSECLIARQKSIMRRLLMDDLDAEPERVRLFQFEKMHALHVAERDRLRAALVQAFTVPSDGRPG
jgi:hypothetical protein